MLKIIIIIAIILIILLIVITYIRCKLTNSKLKKIFKDHSTITFGAKGKGKDLLFQKVVYLRRKDTYLSNMNYGYNNILVPIDKLSVKPNTYENFINGNITQCQKEPLYESKDYFLSDGGIYLPCQYDYMLHKLYPSFPIFYAISRHLYNMNIHINTQNLQRIWKAPREQADYYILCNGKIKLLFGMICKIRLYENYESAERKLLPLGSRFLNKYSKAESDQFYSTNGLIKNCIYYIRYKDIKYDTRYFHKVIFGYEFKKDNKKKKIKKEDLFYGK